MDTAAYERGIALFNQGAFFDAHEVLEDVWREAQDPQRRFLQGLIQAAVALHHYSKGNGVGALSLLGRATKNLAGYPEVFSGIALQPFREELLSWREALARGHAVPPLPKIHHER